MCIIEGTVGNILLISFIYLQPLHYISWFGNWIVAQIMWFFVEFNLQWIGNLAYSYPIDDG